MEGTSVYALGLLSLRVVVRAVLASILHPIIRCQVYGSEPRFLSATGFECGIVLWPLGKYSVLIFQPVPESSNVE